MKQFNLSEWIQDKSRKVVTRDGREVELYYSPTSRIPLIGATTSDNEIHQYTKDGFQCDTFNQAKNDIFFADEEDLTEFDYAVLSVISDHNSHTDSIEAFAKRSSKKLLDLARKELEANYYTKVLDDRMVFKSELHATDLQTAYDMGKQDTLKDLPKWKRDCFHNINSVFDNILYYNDYYIDINGLEKLPKEE